MKPVCDCTPHFSLRPAYPRLRIQALLERVRVLWSDKFRVSEFVGPRVSEALSAPSPCLRAPTSQNFCDLGPYRETLKPEDP